MECVLVNDSCILIDLQKLNLLQEFLKLPYRFMIADILLENELHSLSDNDKKLIRKNFSVQSLTSEEVFKVYNYTQKNPKLSEYDCFSLVLAEKQEDVIFLTSDKALRSLASKTLKTHGLLWVIDKLKEFNILSCDEYCNILQKMLNNSSIRLPKNEIEKRIEDCKK